MKYAICVTFALLLIIPLAAESEDQNTEVSIYSGISFMDAEVEIPGCILCERPVDLFPFSLGKTSIDDSFLFGVKVGHYLNRNMEVEGNFSIAPNHDIHSEIINVCIPGEVCPLRDVIPPDFPTFPSFSTQSPAVAYHYDANFVYNFQFESIRPYFTLGIGGISTDTQFDVQTDFAFNFGGGAKFYFKTLGLRFEVNDHIIPDYFLTGDTENNIQVQYGFLFRLN